MDRPAKSVAIAHPSFKANGAQASTQWTPPKTADPPSFMMPRAASSAEIARSDMRPPEKQDKKG
jgi:hypothetical protein